MHELGIPGCPGHPSAVVGHATGRSRHGRAMPALRRLEWIVIGVISIAKIRPVHIINKAVVIVVYAVSWDLIRIGPHVGQKVFVSPIAAVIHYSDYYRRAHVFSLDHIPRLWQPQHAKLRLIAKERIIWIHALPAAHLRPVNQHRLGIHHARRRSQIGGDLFR